MGNLLLPLILRRNLTPIPPVLGVTGGTRTFDTTVAEKRQPRLQSTSCDISHRSAKMGQAGVLDRSRLGDMTTRAWWDSEGGP